MGLDSIELLVSFEKYFNIQIPDKKAEELRTVQETVDCIAKLLSISDNPPLLRDNIFDRLRKALLNRGLATGTVHPSDRISDRIPKNDIVNWKLISNELGLEIYFPAELRNPRARGSTYEIYVGIMGISVDVLGVDVYEVKPYKRFTDDFGMD